MNSGLSFLSLRERMSMTRGSSIVDLLVRVKSATPAIPCTTSTPIYSVSCEKRMLGSTTLITVSSTFFWPQRGVIVMAQLNLPICLPMKRILSFLASSGLSLIFSLMRMPPEPSMWKTMGSLEVFLISKNS